MKVSISTLKKWFIRGAKPTAEQFHAWIDSFWHKDEKLPESDIKATPVQIVVEYYLGGTTVKERFNILTTAYGSYGYGYGSGTIGTI